MLLKLTVMLPAAPPATSFSTLYRVDAIEAVVPVVERGVDDRFQYPLSGRCY